MRHTDRKKEKDRTAITIMLCLCLIALTSIFTIKASIDKVSKSAGNLPVTQEIATTPQTEEKEENDKTDSEEAEPETQMEEKEAADVSAQTPVVDSTQSQPETTEYLCPVSMETAVVTKNYSMDMVIYNMTLDQYMTHPGIDIEAPKNSGVLAIADGTVTSIYQDDAYGTTIEITHGNGLRSKYANLESAELVEKGDTVTKGQHIANIGQTALYESMEKCHLHFELYKGDTLTNPAEFIDFAS